MLLCCYVVVVMLKNCFCFCYNAPKNDGNDHIDAIQ